MNCHPRCSSNITASHFLAHPSALTATVSSNDLFSQASQEGACCPCNLSFVCAKWCPPIRKASLCLTAKLFQQCCTMLLWPDQHGCHPRLYLLRVSDLQKIQIYSQRKHPTSITLHFSSCQRAPFFFLTKNYCAPK